MAPLREQQRVVLGRYRLGPLLGRGGASHVHRALDVQTGEEVAVKEIPVELEMARRAGAEVRAAGRLSHPAIVRLLDFGEDHSACYLVSELVDGASLADHLRDGLGRDRPDVAVRVVADVLDGLAHAHERGVTHRDVKPANILVDRGGRGRLTDFGIARIAGEAGLTSTGGLVGTVSYMAPEQARGEETGPAADVYSACLALYEALAGRNPIAGASPGETLRRAAEGRVLPLARVRPDLPSSLCRAVDDGLRADPGARPDPAWLARALRAQLPSIGVRRPAPKRLARRLPAIVAAAGAGVVAALLLFKLTDLQPAAALGCAAAAGVAYAASPWRVTLAAWIGGMIALGTSAPGAAVVIGALGLVALATADRKSRAVLLPAAAPILAALGLAPLYAILAGAVPGWRGRIWAAATGAAAIVAWQALAGADPAVDGGRTDGAWSGVEGVTSPITALSRMTSPLSERPGIAIAAAAIAVGALAVPAIRRMRPGVARAAVVAAAFILLVVGVGAAGGSAESVAGAFIPAGILAVAWAASPWRRLRRGADRQTAVTLPASTVERLPAA